MSITVYLPRGELLVATERPRPALGPDDVLVAVQHAALGPPELAALAAAGAGAGVGADFAPGGAAVGIVESAGPAATDQLGRRVLVGPLVACGECDVCRRGRLPACAQARRLGLDTDGAFASHVVARRRWICPLDGGLASAAPGPEAVLAARDLPLAYALTARAGLAAGDVALWLGDDLIAALGRDVARALGAHAPAGIRVAADDTAGAVAAVHAALADVSAALPPPPAWRVLVADTTPAAAATAAALARAGATIGVLGTAAAGPLAAALPALLAAEGVLFGLGHAHPDLVPEAVALVARGEVALTGRARVYPIAAIAEARAAALAEPGTRVVLAI